MLLAVLRIGKKKGSLLYAHRVVVKSLNLVISKVHLWSTAKKCTEMRTTRARRLFFLFNQY